MPKRTAEAVWKGNLAEGKGTVRVESGAFEGAYTFASRFKDGEGTNPEELIGAAHAGCYSMALSHGLAQDGYEPRSVKTRASVTIEAVGEGFQITSILLETVADVPEIGADTFRNHAEQAKNNCPVSVALAGTDIQLKASLKSEEGEEEKEGE